MPRLSLTDFVDVVSKSGSPKATKISQVKTRPDYEPAFDFYKPLREHIVAIHEQDSGKSELNALLQRINDGRKLQHYPELIKGYKQWWGKKQFEWFAPVREIFTDQNVEIIVNPELGLKFKGEQHLIKLYFKPEKLSRLRIEVICYLMDLTLRPMVGSGVSMSVLDVRNSKLFTCEKFSPVLSAMLSGEVAYIASLWDSVGQAPGD